MVTRGNSPLTIGNDDDRFAAARCIDEEQASQGVQTLDRQKIANVTSSHA